MRLRNLVLTITLGAAITVGLLLALSLHAIPAQAQPALAPVVPALDHSDAISDALGYLQTKQLPDGGLECWTPGEADDFTTIKTVVALAAARRPVSFLTSVSGTTPLDYLAARAITYTHDTTGTLFPGRAGMLAVAVVAGDSDPYDFGGMNVTNELTATYHPATGAYSTTAQGPYSSGAAGTINQLWAVLGLAAAQETVPISATDFLIGLQETDGGWGYGFGGNVDVTALVLQALITSGNVGPTHAKVQEGLDYLRAQQDNQGSWGYIDWWTGNYVASADSTAAAIQAIVAAGYTPATESWAHSPNPHTALIDFRAGDGSFSGNALGTAHAIAGLAEASLPIFGRAQRANRALTWMNEQQNGDGSWSGWTGPDPGATCDAVLAFAAAGFDPDSVTAAGSVTSAMDYLSSTASTYADNGPDAAGKLAVAVKAAGSDAYNFGGVNVVHVLTSTHYSPTLGAFGVPTNTWHQAFAILGLAAAGETTPVSATQTLTGLQQFDGGWKYDLSPSPWNTTSPDNTGLAMQALIAAGVPLSDTSVVSATAFLRSQQDAQGGWGNANTTAYAMQGLLAADEDLVADWSSENGHSPYDALATYQKPDGPFVYMWDSPWGPPTDNGMATWQAVPALLGVHYPFLPTGLAPFSPVNRGPDPDRMVACPPRATWGNSVDVIVPFGSDLDADGSITLDWRVSGETSWVTGTTVHRADGYYTATLPVTVPVAYEFQATFADPDEVQYGSEITDTVVLSSTLEPHNIYLPLVLKQ